MKKTIAGKLEVQNLEPENIKSGVNIMGVTGSLESGVPSKSWFYPTEYDENGYPIKIKTIGQSGLMPRYLFQRGKGGGNDNFKVPNFLDKLQEIELNDGITKSNDLCFASLPSLKKVIMPSVIELGRSDFQYSINLEEIVLGANQVCNYWAMNSLCGTSSEYPSHIIVRVPANLIDSYKTATNWANLYNNGIATFEAIE